MRNRFIARKRDPPVPRCQYAGTEGTSVQLFTRVRAVLVLLGMIAQPGQKLGLEEVLARALERAPESLVARSAIAIARADLRTAEMFPNPSLAVSAARSEPKISGGLAFHLPFLGQKQALERAAEHGVVQAE